jgi:hypothetical protein
MMQRFFGQLEKPNVVRSGEDDNDSDSSVHLQPDIDWIAEQGDDDESNVPVQPAMDTFVVGRYLGETFVGFYVICDTGFVGAENYTVELVRKMNSQ